MLTRCPGCETAFRVTPEQLKLRQGKVRCGECQHVFNALETLVEESTIVVSPPVDTIAEEASVETAVLPAPSLETSVELSPQWEPPPPPSPPSQPPPAFEPLLHDLPIAPPRPLRWLWISGITLATLTLLIQSVIHFRVELAVLSPASRPSLEALCSVFGCTVDLPSNVELMTIESSDLQPDTEQKDVLILTATLRNRAPFAQQFPHLELSLTDATDKAIVRRILAPADYLPRGTTAESVRSKGLPNGELSISLPINSGQVGASGYRLYLFYP